MPNIVASTLAFLQGGQDINTLSLKKYKFENLQELELYMLVIKSVCFQQEAKPNFGTVNAMWFLLISDKNISYACVMEADQTYSVVSDRVPNGSLSLCFFFWSLPSTTEPKIRNLIIQEP